MQRTIVILSVLLVACGTGVYVMYKTESAPAQPALLTRDNQSSLMSLTLTSPVFHTNEAIPTKYTCDGENVSPPLQIAGVPDEATSLVLVMDDPDIPDEVKSSLGADSFDHWVLYDIPADTVEIPENRELGTAGLNSAGKTGYTGPCPPSQYEPKEHRYIFRLYAIRGPLQFDGTPTLAEVEAMAEAEMLEQTELIGRYARVAE